MLDAHYNPSDWNTYLFHFSDGDNSSESDNRLCLKILAEKLLPRCNMFGYCQVTSAYGSGSFLGVLREAYPKAQKAAENEPCLVTSKVDKKADIYDSLRTFFGAGR